MYGVQDVTYVCMYVMHDGTHSTRRYMPKHFTCRTKRTEISLCTILRSYPGKHWFSILHIRMYQKISIKCKNSQAGAKGGRNRIDLRGNMDPTPTPERSDVGNVFLSLNLNDLKFPFGSKSL